jgi:hypothetical protein
MPESLELLQLHGAAMAPPTVEKMRDYAKSIDIARLATAQPQLTCVHLIETSLFLQNECMLHIHIPSGDVQVDNSDLIRAGQLIFRGCRYPEVLRVVA